MGGAEKLKLSVDYFGSWSVFWLTFFTLIFKWKMTIDMSRLGLVEFWRNPPCSTLQGCPGKSEEVAVASLWPKGLKTHKDLALLWQEARGR